MGQLLEKFVLIAAVAGLLFTSCVSCVSSYQRKVAVEERIAAPENKLWPSVARIGSMIKDDGPGTGGTAWAIDKDYLITAGHVCSGMMDLIKLEKTNPGVRVIGSNARGDDVEIGKAVILAWHFDESDDMCLLYLKDHGLRPLKVQGDLDLVQTEDPVTISGAPRGAFPIRTDGYVWAINDKVVLLDMPIYPGNSGSPLVWNNQVIGMVISLMKPGGDLPTGFAVRSDLILKFFEENRLKKKLPKKGG